MCFFLGISWRDLCSFTCTAVESLGEFLALFHFCISAKNQDLSIKRCTHMMWVDFTKAARQETD